MRKTNRAIAFHYPGPVIDLKIILARAIARYCANHCILYGMV